MLTIEYRQNLVSTMDKGKEMIPRKFIIGDTCFTSFETIGGNLYTTHAKNLKRVHKDSKDFLLVIIILVTDLNGGYNMNDIGK